MCCCCCYISPITILVIIHRGRVKQIISITYRILQHIQEETRHCSNQQHHCYRSHIFFCFSLCTRFRFRCQKKVLHIFSFSFYFVSLLLFYFHFLLLCVAFLTHRVLETVCHHFHCSLNSTFATKHTLIKLFKCSYS